MQALTDGSGELTGSTELVAWWGAVVATLVLIWDIVKWWTSGPKIRSTMKLDVCYPDSEVISTQNTAQGLVKTLQSYCNIEVVNVGSQATTVLGIEATHKKKKEYKFSDTGAAFQAHFGNPLPQVLKPGEVWSCRFPMDRLENIAKHGRPEIHINLAHNKKPKVLRAPKAVNMSRKADA